MKYHGKELKPITEPQVFDPPKLMLVWDDDTEAIQKRNVIAILPECDLIRRVMTSGGVCWSFCAECEEIQPRRATNLEFSKWLSQGYGQVHTDSNCGMTDTAVTYDDKCDDTPVRDGLMARKWGDKDWHEPTIDYLGINEG